MRIGVVGANGKVGSELCLLLRNQPGVQLVPVCRNRSGSAFLRYHGLACRHGLVTDVGQAPRLLADCDVVVNCALSQGSPREAQLVHRAVVKNTVRHSGAGARVVFLSSAIVYGDSRPGGAVLSRGVHGADKLHLERRFLAAGRRLDRECYVLRLGHMCGALQPLTLRVREAILSGPVLLPETDYPSITVYTATLTEAILRIGQGREAPGTYDLLCKPVWTWRRVFEYEASQCGLSLEFEPTPVAQDAASVGRSVLVGPRRLMRGLLARPAVKRSALRLLPWLSERLNQRARALVRLETAGGDIVLLASRARLREPFTWACSGPPVSDACLRSLSPTAELLGQERFRVPPRENAPAWPADLPDADARLRDRSGGPHRSPAGTSAR